MPHFVMKNRSHHRMHITFQNVVESSQQSLTRIKPASLKIPMHDQNSIQQRVLSRNRFPQHRVHRPLAPVMPQLFDTIQAKFKVLGLRKCDLSQFFAEPRRRFGILDQGSISELHGLKFDTPQIMQQSCLTFAVRKPFFIRVFVSRENQNIASRNFRHNVTARVLKSLLASFLNILDFASSRAHIKNHRLTLLAKKLVLYNNRPSSLSFKLASDITMEKDLKNGKRLEKSSESCQRSKKGRCLHQVCSRNSSRIKNGRTRSCHECSFANGD